MKKFFSLLKAALSQDMNLFKYNTKQNSSKLKRFLFPVFLFLVVATSIGFYAYMLAEPLHKVNLTYIMLTMFLAIVTVLTFFSGIYKSQGILFEAKDNDLLFSLPIKKSYILSIRILKLIIFQYIYNLMFLLPAFVVYIIFEKPGISFYLLSLLMSILLPLIPTVISSILGYLVKMISSRFKSKKIIQTLLSLIIFMAIYFASLNLDSFIKDIATKAQGINDFITRIYYPIGTYISLINDFDIITLIKLILINIVPMIIFIYIGAKFYFKIIFKSKETAIKSKKITKKDLVKQNSPIRSLTKKELKRYFSSPVYMLNTCFGLIIILVISIAICIKGDEAFKIILKTTEMDINTTISLLFYGLILFTGTITSITSSSISLEGKTINITKSLPVKETTILNAKILMCMIIELPFILFADIIYVIVYHPSILSMLSLLITSFSSVILSAVIGLLINLKYPKMNASNDTEVVKQSMSSMLSVFIGMAIFIISMLLIGYLSDYLKIDHLTIIHSLLVSVITLILYKVLLVKGPKEYKSINV
ncbi:MAG: hypothetical protein SPJ06_06375 [Bacilli bacterium]|nr:hypothetical protein [Bacilli bacterium]